MDIGTSTILATRSVDFAVSKTINYMGIDLTFDKMPQPGDLFRVNGNNGGPNGAFDAHGDNGNLISIIDIESRKDLIQQSYGTDGLTLTETYTQMIGEIGGLATQANIAEDALQIMKDHAEMARSAVAGVSLDEEASSLIRFQQAYQACAKVIDLSNKLFDAVLAVR